MHKPKLTPKHSLVDRFSIAYLSGLFAFVSSGFIWFAIISINPLELAIPFSIVWWFTGSMAVAGFLLQENLLVTIFEKLWSLIKALWYII